MHIKRRVAREKGLVAQMQSDVMQRVEGGGCVGGRGRLRVTCSADALLVLSTDRRRVVFVASRLGVVAAPALASPPASADAALPPASSAFDAAFASSSARA